MKIFLFILFYFLIGSIICFIQSLIPYKDKGIQQYLIGRSLFFDPDVKNDNFIKSFYLIFYPIWILFDLLIFITIGLPCLFYKIFLFIPVLVYGLIGAILKRDN